MMLIQIAIMFILCMFLYKPGFKFFLFWLALSVIMFFLVDGSVGLWGFILYCVILGASGEETSTSSTPRSVRTSNKSYTSNCSYDPDDDDDSFSFYDKTYEDGTHRVKNISNTGYYYSDGRESWLSLLGDEHRSNGEIVRENAFIPGRRDIYNANNEYIGYEYVDFLGITRRVDEK